MKGCGFTYPPPEDSSDREALDAFADFLRILNSAPQDAEGRYLLPQQAFDYAHGRATRPCEPDDEATP